MEVRSKTFSLNVPASWEYEWETNVEHATLMLWKKDRGSTLRITSLIIEPASKFSAERHAYDLQKKVHGKIFKKNDFYAVSYKIETEQNNVPLIQDYWELAKSNRLFIISYTVDKQREKLSSTRKEKKTST